MTSSLECISGNPATSNSITMDGSLAPEVTFTHYFDTVTTTNAKPIRLKGGVPLGGAYFGTGVSGGSEYYFDPGVEGPGMHEILYHYINEAGCEDSAKICVFNSQFSVLNCGDS